MAVAHLAAALGPWLSDQLGAEATIGELRRPEGVGHSSDTVLLDATWADEGGTKHDESLVIRLEVVEPGVFPTYDLSLQVACLRNVGQHTAVPVPAVRWLELDPSIVGRTFYVMDRIDGEVPADRMPYTIDGFLLQATEAEQAQLWWSSLETMAGLHQLDWEASGFEVLDRTSYGPAGLSQQLAWWEDYVTWVGAGRELTTIGPAGEWLRANLPADPPPTGLNWGDARISNMLYREFQPVAVLDWELAALGPAEVDLAWFLFFQAFFSTGIGIDDLPGFPSRDESIARYAELLGRPIADLFWYDVFAAWRHCAIMLRLADLSTDTGEFPAGNDAGLNNIATRMLAPMLDLPIPGPPGGPMG